MRTFNTISLFSGTGMLDIGAHAALRRLGYNPRTVAYCERDRNCRKQLVARITDGLLGDAPIWPDVLTFPGARYRGHADAVVAGFPCQPFSVAGKRAGTKDARYLFDSVVRIALDAGVSILLLENVPGLLLRANETLDGGTKQPVPAPVSDVSRILAESRFDARWTSLAAEEIGAPHGRERFWCVGFKLADSISS